MKHMKYEDLVVGQHIVVDKRGRVGLVMQKDDDLVCCYTAGGFDIIGLNFTVGEWTKRKIKEVRKINRIDILFQDNDFIKSSESIWKIDDKVECIIDGQTIMLSRESVDELKKLK